MIKIPEGVTEKLDDWVLSTEPPLSDILPVLADIRRLIRDARVAEAHLVGYAHYDLYGLTDFDETPEDLKENTWDDDDS